MLAGNKYRFPLQWGNDTAEKAMAGQLLDRLGNKKSEFVVLALTEYIQAHPEVAAPGGKIQINVHPTQSEEQLQTMVKELAKAAVEELMAGMTIVPTAGTGEAMPTGPSQEDLDAMLENLDLFK